MYRYHPDLFAEQFVRDEYGRVLFEVETEKEKLGNVMRDDRHGARAGRLMLNLAMAAATNWETMVNMDRLNMLQAIAVAALSGGPPVGPPTLPEDTARWIDEAMAAAVELGNLVLEPGTGHFPASMAPRYVVDGEGNLIENEEWVDRRPRGDTEEEEEGEDE